jgi:hypothetical protein
LQAAAVGQAAKPSGVNEANVSVSVVPSHSWSGHEIGCKRIDAGTLISG